MGASPSCSCEKMAQGARQTITEFSTSSSTMLSPGREAQADPEKVVLSARSEASQASKFKNSLRDIFTSKKDAFQRLGGNDDDIIDEEEFKESLRKHMGYTEKDEHLVKKLFLAIDANGDGQISWKEFKDHVREGGDETRSSGSMSPKGARSPKSPKGSLSPKASRRDLSSEGMQSEGAGRRLNIRVTTDAGETDFRAFIDFLKGKFKDPHSVFAGQAENSDSGCFDSSDFKQIVERTGYSTETAESIFRFLDVAKDGTVTWHELQLQLAATWDTAPRAAPSSPGSPSRRTTTGSNTLKRRKSQVASKPP